MNWWAHQDLNLGPKDYEQLQEIKPITNQQVTSDPKRCGSKCGSNFLYFTNDIDRLTRKINSLFRKSLMRR